MKGPPPAPPRGREGNSISIFKVKSVERESSANLQNALVLIKL